MVCHENCSKKRTLFRVSYQSLVSCVTGSHELQTAVTKSDKCGTSSIQKTSKCLRYLQNLCATEIVALHITLPSSAENVSKYNPRLYSCSFGCSLPSRIAHVTTVIGEAINER